MSEEKSEKKRENEEKSAGLSNSRQNYPKFGKNVPNPLAHKGKSLVDVRSPLGRNGSGYKISKKKLKEVQLSNKDRKSTRLNSSHVSISYAVFCLKKKISASCSGFAIDLEQHLSLAI